MLISPFVPFVNTLPLPCQATFPLLGVPLTVRSNNADVIALAEHAFAHWRMLPENLIKTYVKAHLDLLVQPGEHPGEVATPFVRRVQAGTLLAASGSNLLLAQVDHGLALGFVTPETLADTPNFQANVLEWLALLVCGQDRVPLPAGALVSNGCAVLLIGTGAADISLLAYACLRAGWHFLADTRVYVSRQEGVRLWGSTPRLHLPPTAAQRMPELPDRAALVTLNGEQRLVIDVAATYPHQVALTAERAIVCLVQPQSGLSSLLEPVEPADAVDIICQPADAPELHPNMREVATLLTHGGAYRLRAGGDLAGAVALLRSLVV